MCLPSVISGTLHQPYSQVSPTTAIATLLRACLRRLQLCFPTEGAAAPVRAAPRESVGAREGACAAHSP